MMMYPYLSVAVRIAHMNMFETFLNIIFFLFFDVKKFSLLEYFSDNQEECRCGLLL